MNKLKMDLTIGGKNYELPKVSTEAYLNYLDVREPIVEKEENGRLYTRKDFYAMADALVELYGNQFTREQLLAADGLTPGEVIVKFSAVESVLVDQVDKSVAELKETFTPAVTSKTS